MSTDEEGIRLQKVLASAGVGSRRASEQLIAEGRVSIDGQTAELGARVDPQLSIVRVDGKRINLRADLVYLALNKPRGVLTAMTDPQGRPNVGDYVADQPERLFHVGRLDADTEGLLILTNDGDFAHRLAHPSHEVAKTYVAQVPGPVDPRLGQRLREGVELEDGPAAVDSFRIIDSSGDRALVEVSLHSGRNRIVRRLLEEVGHPVIRLVRVAVGPVRLGDQRPGTLRGLTGSELSELYRLIGL
ncbi:MAG: rRNA pseudouridine synthase [Frankiales bacterium]|nr:rRNA pseudouridine synthase [Frankiales bacterium]